MLSKKMVAGGIIAIAALAAAPASAASLSVQVGQAPQHQTQYQVPQLDPAHNPGWGGWRRDGDRDGPRWNRDRDARGWGYGGVSQRQVQWILRKNGYRNIRFLERYGPFYQVRADRRDQTYLVIVSARDGRILGRQGLRNDWGY